MLKNADFRAKVEVASMADKMQEARLRWFEHVKKEMHSHPYEERWDVYSRGLEERLRQAEELLGEVIKQDIANLQLTKNMTLDRKVWMPRIWVDN